MRYEPDEHWEWETRTVSPPRLRGHRIDPGSRPAPSTPEWTALHGRIKAEVKVTQGICVTWRCSNPAPDGPECEEHAREPLPKSTRDRSAYVKALSQRFASDPAWAQKERERKREVSRRARQDPKYRERHNARKRAQRAAQTQLATGGAS